MHNINTNPQISNIQFKNIIVRLNYRGYGKRTTDNYCGKKLRKGQEI